MTFEVIELSKTEQRDPAILESKLEAILREAKFQHATGAYDPVTENT